METIKEAWSGILDYLHRQDDISEVAYNVWISCIEPRSIEDGEVVVYVHTQFQKKSSGNIMPANCAMLFCRCSACRSD